MRASTARWALATLSILGLAGCKSGSPSWWPGRNKMPAYSTSSTTPPPGASQYQMPSSQVAPYGSAEHSHDGGQSGQQPAGADQYGANGNYSMAADAAGQNAYSNVAGGMNAATPQTGPYCVGASNKLQASAAG